MGWSKFLDIKNNDYFQIKTKSHDMNLFLLLDFALFLTVVTVGGGIIKIST